MLLGLTNIHRFLISLHRHTTKPAQSVLGGSRCPKALWELSLISSTLGPIGGEEDNPKIQIITFNVDEEIGNVLTCPT